MKTETLCWNCKNSLGSCSWSDELKPVEGWDATPSRFAVGFNTDGSPRIMKTFCVQSCPYYIEDKRKVNLSNIAALIGKSQRDAAYLACQNFGKLQELVRAKGYKLRHYKTDSKYEYYIERL